LDEIREYEKRVEESTSCLIYVDGKEYDSPVLVEAADPKPVIEFDPLEFYALVDLFAKEYGLGACRSLTEFSQMIDNEDPALLDGLLYSMRKRYEAEAGDSDSEPPTGTREAFNRRTGSSTFRNAWGHDSDMTDFLVNSGMDPQAVKEAKARLKERKINTKEEQEYHQWLYSTVTPESIRDPNFNLKEALEKISAHNKNTEKFNISASTIFKGPR
jgi:hypothetical protein